jgi:hypothetical protein
MLVIKISKHIFVTNIVLISVYKIIQLLRMFDLVHKYPHILDMLVILLITMLTLVLRHKTKLIELMLHKWHHMYKVNMINTIITPTKMYNFHSVLLKNLKINSQWHSHTNTCAYNIIHKI